jgi:hypothetical protein
MRRILLGLTLASVLGTSWWLATAAEPAKSTKTETRVFELRTYYAPPGQMPKLLARFRDHTCKLFAKHNITIIGFWLPTDAKEAETKLVYLLAHASQADAAKNFAAFRADPDWLSAKEASEKAGKIVDKVESVFLTPTDFSALK